MAPKRTNNKTRVARKSSPPKTVNAMVVVVPKAQIVAKAEMAEAEMVSKTKVSVGSGRPKDEADYDSIEDDDETELEDVDSPNETTRHQSGSQGKRKMSTPALGEDAKKWKARAIRAERPLKVISSTRVINAFQEGEVRQYAKQVLWKKVKFITCDETMVQCMKDAASAFDVKDAGQQDWMSTYSHCVREAINAQRNHCCQELRKTILSKWPIDDSEKPVYM